MTRHALVPALLCALVALAACGRPGGGYRVTGEVGQACLVSGRAQSTRALCGCIDQVAARTLTASEQRTVAGYFADPEALQAMKIDDRPAAERLWARYDAFVETAQATCGG